MIKIYYWQMVVAISTLWLIVRSVCGIKNKKIDVKRELVLLLVYICIVVVVRFTFCPFGLVEGKIQPLLFDAQKIFPMWVNFIPFVYWLDYPDLKDVIINLVGNTAMFIPLGIVWPAVFKKLDSPPKAIAAGVGFSLCIEILQLPFFERATDIDDLILNCVGYLIGYGIYALVKKITATIRKEK